MIDIKQYLEQTNTVLLTKDAFEYLKERASVPDKVKAEYDPSADLISREKTLTAFADYVGSGMSMDDYDALWDIVAKMPAVNPQPCEDAISRQAALGCCRNEWEEEVEIRLKSLPPVNPTKTGHWIEHPEIETSAPEYLMFYECSECGDRQCFCKSDIHKKRFCSNCGCRMVKPQESEE